MSLRFDDSLILGKKEARCPVKPEQALVLKIRLILSQADEFTLFFLSWCVSFSFFFLFCIFMHKIPVFQENIRVLSIFFIPR